MKKRIFIASTVLLLSSTLASCGQAHVDKDYYDFCYNVNYDGGSSRVDKIAKGSKASKWSAKREGFSLVDWYNEPECRNVFNFETSINDDTIIYAKWQEGGEREKVTITFNFNYPNCQGPVRIEGYTGDFISISDIPTANRFNHTMTGWYKDANCTKKWSFSNDVVAGDMDLYAGYVQDESIQYGPDGKIAFDGVSINFAPHVMFWGDHNEIDDMIVDFNAAYSGKIRVNRVEFGSGENVTLEDTAFINESYNDYYNVGEVLDNYGEDFNEDDFNEKAIAENYLFGSVKSMPFAHFTPFLVYDKTVMADMGMAKLPNNHADIYNLLLEANEIYKTSPDWAGAMGTSISSWPKHEIVNHSMWSNSGFNFLSYDEEAGLYSENFTNDVWKDRFVSSVKGGNRIFGYTSPVNADYVSMADTRDLASHNTMMVMIGEWGDIGYLLDYSGIHDAKTFAANYGVASAYNLCNYGNYEDSGVFSKGLSFGVRATTNDPYKVAASAVFAKWMSEHATGVSNKYVYPANKKAYTDPDFTQNGELAYKILRAGVDPTRTMTMTGHRHNYRFFNYTNQNFYSSIMSLATINDGTIENLREAFGASVEAYLGE